MKPVIKAKWVAALRSGKYKQGTCQLRNNNDEYCCLGVLCDIISPEKWEYDGIRYRMEGHQVDLPSSILKNVSSGELLTDRLTYMNDIVRMSFDEIADYIEGRL